MNKKNNQNTNNKLELNYIISDHLKKSHKPNTIDEFYPYLAGYNQENGRLRKIWKEEKCRSIKIKKKDLPLINYIKKNLTQEGKRGVADLKSGKIKIIKSFKEINYVIEDQDISIIGPRQRGQNTLWAFNIHRGRPRLEGSGGWEYKYPNYWLTGYLDRNIKWKDIKLNMKILIKRNKFIFKKEPTPIVFVIKNVGPRFPTNDILMEKIKEFNSNLISGPRLPSVPSGGFERLKGKAARPPYKIKERFPTKIIRSIIWYLDKYPLISYKYIKYIKIRKIYRICQRKEHLTKKGLLKILSIWRYHNYLT